MKIKRIISNVESTNLEKATRFYGDIFGLEILMDHGWILTYGSSKKMNVQISFATEDGSGTSAPDAEFGRYVLQIDKQMSQMIARQRRLFYA